MERIMTIGDQNLGALEPYDNAQEFGSDRRLWLVGSRGVPDRAGPW